MRKEFEQALDNCKTANELNDVLNGSAEKCREIFGFCMRALDEMEETLKGVVAVVEKYPGIMLSCKDPHAYNPNAYKIGSYQYKFCYYPKTGSINWVQEGGWPNITTHLLGDPSFNGISAKSIQTERDFLRETLSANESLEHWTRLYDAAQYTLQVCEIIALAVEDHSTKARKDLDLAVKAGEEAAEGAKAAMDRARETGSVPETDKSRVDKSKPLNPSYT